MARHTLAAAALAIAAAFSPASSSAGPSPPPAPRARPAPAKPWIPVAARPVRPEAVGLWRVPSAERVRRSPGEVAMPGVVRFLYDGESVTLQLLTEHAWMYRTRDDHYRVASRWNGDVLQYRPPFGQWAALARFRDGHFESIGDKPPWRYLDVRSRAGCEADDLPLLAARPVHDYTIEPTDRSP